MKMWFVSGDGLRNWVYLEMGFGDMHINSLLLAELDFDLFVLSRRMLVMKFTTVFVGTESNTL